MSCSSGVLPKKRRVDAPDSEAPLGLLERIAMFHREVVEDIVVEDILDDDGLADDGGRHGEAGQGSKWPHLATTLSTAQEQVASSSQRLDRRELSQQFRRGQLRDAHDGRDAFKLFNMNHSMFKQLALDPIKLRESKDD